MGLFGLLLTAASGGILFADSCRTASENADSREKARREGRQVYVDNKGNYRLVTTNEVAYIYGDKLKLAQNGQVVCDYKKARIKKQNDEYIAKAKEKGLKGCQLIYPEFNDRRYYTEFSTGRRYYLSINQFARPHKYYICYYTGNHSGTSCPWLTDWEDEKREVTVEEYRLYGGYEFCTDGQGKHIEL